jgi:hypothetical protein
MELGAAGGGSRGRPARLGADRRLGKPTALQIGADRGEAARDVAGQGRRRSGAAGFGSSRRGQGAEPESRKPWHAVLVEEAWGGGDHA